ncbi:inorganic diphosphatase [Adhaeribacter sp. BT258]|uniref:inorganic diphosphatase n=1 Tax=Adhaeribacter terrigena TaxID=2793070 RepID=A0ABS1BWF0_9BACT|nr:inorganic diphosphatase [Adhaeribacter terrigena]MBK0401457.1 inorganic diphosphatase [Adhaeribacter terrigena]
MTFNFTHIPALAESSGLAHVIIDTPKGSRNKFKFDEEKGLFKLKHVLPEGMVFPYDFGFIPNTLTEDGDPLDVLVLLDAPTFAGCLVETRIIGVLEAEQTGKDGKPQLNDRLIGVFAESEPHAHMQELRDLPRPMIKQIEHFFRSYNQMRDIEFNVLSHAGAKKALQLIRKNHADSQ